MCYLDKYALILLILSICIFLIEKYRQKKIISKLERTRNKEISM
ncbi:hypothetical protein [Clostridium tertium]